jgi:hypothetical protein
MSTPSTTGLGPGPFRKTRMNAHHATASHRRIAHAAVDDTIGVHGRPERGLRLAPATARRPGHAAC